MKKTESGSQCHFDKLCYHGLSDQMSYISVAEPVEALFRKSLT